MLFSRSKNKDTELEDEHTLEAETIARWRSIAAGERPSQSSTTIELSEEAVLPETEQYHLGTSKIDIEDEVERFDGETVSWPANTREIPRYDAPPSPAAASPAASATLETSIASRDATQQSFGLGQDNFGMNAALNPKLQAMATSEPNQARVEETIVEATMEIPTPHDSLARKPMLAEAAPAIHPPIPPSSEQAVLPANLAAPFEQDLKRRFGSNIKSALGPGTMIDGTFRFDTPVCVDGTLTGEVCSSSALIVGPQACVEASIIVGSLIVQGTVVGDVEADELIEIRAGGQLIGDVETRRIVIEEGGQLSGKCRMLD